MIDLGIELIPFPKEDKAEIGASMKDLFQFKNTYYLTMNNEKYGIGEINHVYSGIELRIGLFKEYQHLCLGPMFLDALTLKAGFMNMDDQLINLYIKPDNSAMRKTALNCGYECEISEIDNYLKEGYLCYQKENPFYRKSVNYVRKL